MSSEIGAVEAWLYDTLNDDATLGALVTGVYAYQAPDTATFPYVLFNQQSGVDVQGVGPTRIMSNMLYTVRAVTDGTMGSLVTISDRIDTLLQAQSGSNSDGTVLACVREEVFTMNEIIDSRPYRNLGGIYRIFVQ